MKQRPKRLYRYRSLGDQQAMTFAKAMITKGEMYFASHLQFNDPFESRFSFSMEKGTPEGWRKLLTEMLEAGGKVEPPVTEAELSALAHIVSQEVGTNLADWIWKDISEKFAMCCLSEKPDDILMWAHYADCHRGICVEFDASVPESMFGNAEPVLYADSFPALDWFTSTEEERARAAVTTKARHWQYEHEWRILVSGGGGVRPFDPELITGIIFGCRCDTAMLEMVQQWCQANPRAVSLYRAITRKGAYALDIEPLSSSSNATGDAKHAQTARS